MKDWFYETYVQGHLEEHQRSRFKHWLILLALSWKYRRSQINRLHTLTLAKLKDNKAKIRMEWIPGACCYNLYVSQDGLHYRFQEKTRNHLCEVENLKQDQMYFFKFKVSMDGSRYSFWKTLEKIQKSRNFGGQQGFPGKLSPRGNRGDFLDPSFRGPPL